MEWWIILVGAAAITGIGFWLIKSVISKSADLRVSEQRLKEVLEATERAEKAERNRPRTAGDALDRL